MAEQPDGRTIAARFARGERPSLGEQGSPSSPRRWRMGERSELEFHIRGFTVFVVRSQCRLRVLAPMRNWRNAGMDRPGFTASPEAAAWGAYATRFWESPGCGMCFRARRRLSRRERMAGECGRVSSGPLVPSLIRSYRAEAGITAEIAENAIHRGWPQFPVGRWTDRIDWSLTTGALRQCQLPAVYVKGELYKTRAASRGR